MQAARHGHLDVLKHAHKQGCPVDARVCAAAAYGGHVELLEYLRAEEVPWDEQTCAYAALGGHLSVLQWARARMPVEHVHVRVQRVGG